MIGRALRPWKDPSRIAQDLTIALSVMHLTPAGPLTWVKLYLSDRMADVLKRTADPRSPRNGIPQMHTSTRQTPLFAYAHVNLDDGDARMSAVVVHIDNSAEEQRRDEKTKAKVKSEHFYPFVNMSDP
jgi:hypothetical protein